MQAVSINVKQAIGDADIMIFLGTALQCATSSQEVVVIGTDTDLLVMLVHVARSPTESTSYLSGQSWPQ